MKGQFNVISLDKCISKYGVLNSLLNRILNFLIPQTEAIACTPTNYYELGPLCDPYYWYCDTTTQCQIYEKHYTNYYPYQGAPTYCQICNWWVNTRQICSPCIA